MNLLQTGQRIHYYTVVSIVNELHLMNNQRTASIALLVEIDIVVIHSMLSQERVLCIIVIIPTPFDIISSMQHMLVARGTTEGYDLYIVVVSINIL